MTTPPVAKIPDPVNQREKMHQRQVLWQVYVPAGASAVVIIVLAVLAAVAASGGTPELTRWSNISLLWLITPAFLMGLAFLLLLVGVIYVLARLKRGLPPYAHLVQAYFALGAALVRLWSDRIVEPIMAIHSMLARGRSLRQRIFGRHLPRQGA